MPMVVEKKSNVFIIIPARHGSTRLPGKPLLKIAGQSIIVRVATRAKQLEEKLLNNNKVNNVFLMVATDHETISYEIKKIGIQAVMTSSELKNGTERVFAALKQFHNINENDIIVNIQGDEPFFSIEDLENLIIEMLNNKNVPMGTLAFPRNDPSLFLSSSVVKVVRDTNRFALYFSRSPIPFPKIEFDALGKNWLVKANDLINKVEFLHHVGIYVFRYNSLCEYSNSSLDSQLEIVENLEQLRALEWGWKILVIDASQEPFGIDTTEDLDKANLFALSLNEIKV
ncbi:MAG: 3-deoxy-manno-octulosonate cytidylyltransferase [Spirobacillus cienkowskii]|jgi:3-deoxy-manno-octulosonate cytidylyltransferase (CMP-KDO synthetase)|uniref:3-deoxy-manno-octulosonate cytidylyltransferase n=1 Tax=Spirobacillus cienkowskii TaxID=495820 RepID=A0A369KWG7_9BACT|nr:MAG: 3-deoxy-manno-octulosonate cytidylyltransferase [Spirobacillus cienkowskii]